jgi:hypothetical protein
MILASEFVLAAVLVGVLMVAPNVADFLDRHLNNRR